MCVRQDHLGDRADHDETIETIEQRDEVTLNSDEYFFFFFYLSIETKTRALCVYVERDARDLLEIPSCTFSASSP